MKDEILNELLQEILKENEKILDSNEKIKDEQKFLKTAFENFATNEKDAIENLKNLKLNVDASKLENFFNDRMRKQDAYLEYHTKNLINERKEIIKTISNWKEALISIAKILIISFVIMLTILSIGKYYMPIIKENSKYKNAFEYIYYTNKESQDYLQKLILNLDDKKQKKIYIKETKELKQKSSNPLVHSK